MDFRREQYQDLFSRGLHTSPEAENYYRNPHVFQAYESIGQHYDNVDWSILLR